MNEKNLRSLADLTEREQREIAQRGGRASAEARRNKKMMRKVVEYILYELEPPEAWKKKMMDEGFAENEITHQLIITMALVKKAECGDVQAYNTICAMLGEKPSEKLDLSGRIEQKIEIGFVESEHLPKSSESDVDIGK